MYRVGEYYQFSGRLDPVRHLEDFDSLDKAKSFARETYQHLTQVPESERVRVCIVDRFGRVAFTLPSDGADGTAT